MLKSKNNEREAENIQGYVQLEEWVIVWQTQKFPMGNSFVGFKGNETKFKVIIKTEWLKLFFSETKNKLIIFKKNYLKK